MSAFKSKLTNIKKVHMIGVKGAGMTALAEILGGAIALNMLFNIPLKLASAIVSGFVLWALYTNSYRRLEKLIIAFVSLIGLAFLAASRKPCLAQSSKDIESESTAWKLPSNTRIFILSTG